MGRSLLLIAIPAILAAQDVYINSGPQAMAPQKPPSPAEDLCVVEGQIFNASTGEPIRKATVVMNRTELGPGDGNNNYMGASDAQGKFVIQDVEPGKYRLNASRNGFVSMAYGAHSPGKPGTTLTLATKQHAADIVFKLIPHGVITGRILDEDGEPLANAQVALLSYRYQQGKKQLSNSQWASTNDLGEYRIFGVAPGKYYLSANAPPMMTGGRMNADVPEEYVPAYYPGTSDASSAAPVVVGPGAQMRGVDITLFKKHTVRIKGHVNSAVAGRGMINVLLVPRNTSMVTSLNSTRADSQGNFDIHSVLPGSYRLQAQVMGGPGGNYVGRTDLEVGQTNLDGLVVTIGPNFSVSGTLRVDGDANGPNLTNIRLGLQARDSEAMMFGGGSQGRVDAQGHFEIPNVPPGEYYLAVANPPAGFYIKSMRSEQIDVLTSGLNLTNGGAPNVEVVISPNAASFSGTVQDPRTGNPSPGASVVLIPLEKERRDQQLFYKTAISDSNGAFSFKGLMPGEYKAYAWEDLEAGAYMDPDFMKPVESAGEAVPLHENDMKTAQLKLIPADGPDVRSGGQ